MVGRRSPQYSSDTLGHASDGLTLGQRFPIVVFEHEELDRNGVGFCWCPDPKLLLVPPFLGSSGGSRHRQRWFLLEKNGKLSGGKRIKHIYARYFLLQIGLTIETFHWNGVPLKTWRVNKGQHVGGYETRSTAQDRPRGAKKKGSGEWLEKFWFDTSAKRVILQNQIWFCRMPSSHNHYYNRF